MTKTSTTSESNSILYHSVKTRRLNVGIVGAGLMGCWHANAARCAGGRINAIVDSNIETSRYLAGKYSYAKSYSSVEQMLNQTDINVLHICTPLDTHVKIAELALNAGINLVIEKPITPTAVETERILGQAARSGTLVCVVHQFLFQEGVQKAKKAMPRIGKLIHIGSTISSAGAEGLAAKQHDLIAADILPHPLSLMQYFIPDSISDEVWMAVRLDYGELRAFCKTAKTSLSIFISMHARPTECSLWIVGTNGTIHLDLFHGFSVIESGNTSRLNKILHPFSLSGNRLLAASLNLCKRTIRRELAYPGLNALISTFYDSIRYDNECPISHEDTLAVALVRDMLLESAGLK